MARSDPGLLPSKSDSDRRQGPRQRTTRCGTAAGLLRPAQGGARAACTGAGRLSTKDNVTGATSYDRYPLKIADAGAISLGASQALGAYAAGLPPLWPPLWPTCGITSVRAGGSFMSHLYGVLGVSPKANRAAVKSAFRSLAKTCHPDMQGGDELRFKEVADAYATLVNPARRAAYDAQCAFARTHARRRMAARGWHHGRDLRADSRLRGGGGRLAAGRLSQPPIASRGGPQEGASAASPGLLRTGVVGKPHLPPGRSDGLQRPTCGPRLAQRWGRACGRPALIERARSTS